MATITKEELKSLYSLGTSVSKSDRFHIETASGELLAVSAEWVRAYLAKGMGAMTNGSSSPLIRAGESGIETSLDDGETYVVLLTWGQIADKIGLQRKVGEESEKRIKADKELNDRLINAESDATRAKEIAGDAKYIADIANSQIDALKESLDALLKSDASLEGAEALRAQVLKNVTDIAANAEAIRILQEKEVKITVDNVLSPESENPVQNKVLYEKFEEIEAPATPTKLGMIIIGSDFDVSAEGVLTLYKAMAINSFTNDKGTQEKGATVQKVTLRWTLNKVPKTLTFNGESIDVSLNTMVVEGNFTTRQEWNLKATDDKGKVASSTSVLSFSNKFYYGTSAKSSLMDADILGMTKSVFASSYNLAQTEFNCTGGKYPYFCFPKSWGTPSFIVGGLPNSDFVSQEIEFTNASGYTETYVCWRTNGIQTGKLLIQVK